MDKPHSIRPHNVCAVGAQLGEGPIWVMRDQALWFVDIIGENLHRYRPDNGRLDVWKAPAKISFALPVRGGGFVAGLKTGLHRFSPASGDFTHIMNAESHLPDNRPNDACIDSAGTLWFGSMHDLETEASGVLYQLDKGLLVVHDSGYVVTNGPAFSPDGRTFYHTDSANRVVYAFDREVGGALANKRALMRLNDRDGYPDGTTVDAEGCLWIALWGGWAVRRYSPRGEHLATVQLPCAKVTKIAFGGADLQTAYVTTASTGLSPSEQAAQPQAGDLFSFRSSIAGLPSLECEI
jgi:xylono-1,5-lactonase